MGGVFFMWLERVFDMMFLKVPAVITYFKQEERYSGEGRVVQGDTENAGAKKV